MVNSKEQKPTPGAKKESVLTPKDKERLDKLFSEVGERTLFYGEEDRDEWISRLSEEGQKARDYIFEKLESFGLKRGLDFEYSPTLVRGLDYYTGAIFELKPSSDPKSLSIGSGGRYDNLIGMFSKKETPAVGFSFGLDRLIEALPG